MPPVVALARARRRFVVAAAGGLAATAVDVAALTALVRHGAPIAVAAFLGAAAGAVTSFVASKHLAFGDRSPVTAAQLARFAGIAAVSALLVAAAMEVVSARLGVPYLLAKVPCAVLIFAGWSFPAQRRLFAASSS